VRKQFWVTVVEASAPDQLAEVDPVAATVSTMIALPGCSGAHGLRLHPDGQSAFIACEGNDQLARVDLAGTQAVAIARPAAAPMSSASIRGSAGFTLRPRVAT